MEKLTFDNFVEFNLEKLDAGDFIDSKKWAESLLLLKELKAILDYENRIIKEKNQIPRVYVSKVNNFTRQFIAKIEEYISIDNKDVSSTTSRKAQWVNNVNVWYSECLDFQKNTYNHFFDLYLTVKSYDFIPDTDTNELNKYIETEKESILNAKTSIDNILEEVRRKTSKIPISDYAAIFKVQATQNNRAAYIWLTVGIFMILTFVIYIFCFDIGRLLPSQTIGVTSYNIDNIVLKILLFSIYIFMISFSMKQFSINRHLATINKHRQNGFNSFILFSESINKEDSTLRHELILQLAKVVYEQSNTGYLGEKGSGINSSIVEITKMINGTRSGGHL